MPDSAIEYFHAVVPSAPLTLRKHLLALPHDTVHAVDALLRFVLDAPCPPTAPWDDHSAWAQAQNEVAWRIAQLRKNTAAAAAATAAAATANASTSAGHKRSHDEASPAPPASTSAAAGPSKRPKIDDAAAAVTAAPTDADDPPLFTLHALSITSPIRKKADITIHAHTLRLTSGPARTPEAPPVPLAALRRAFLLPTRGKSKPHWTVLFMPSDVPVAAGRAGAEARERERAGAQAPLVAFGVDAVPSAPLTTATYAASQPQTQSQPQTTVHPRGAPAEPALRAFLAHFHTPPLEPRTDVFRSAAGAGAGAADVAGVEAYRGAKPGTLWFLSEGILWDGRPAEFFALRDVAPGAAAGADADADAPEGVRTLSATGRTCSVLIRRRGDDEDGGEDEGEARVAEVDFGMVDGKEQEGIARWVRRHRHLFGRAAAAPPPRAGAGPSGPTAAADEDADADEDAEDAEDEDFVASESDDGSATSESDGDGSGAETVDEDGEGAGGDDESEEGEEEEGALDPARHPLLRPGALAMRLSRAAVEMAVGIVEQDFVGSADAEGEGDEEEDELED